MAPRSLPCTCYHNCHSLMFYYNPSTPNSIVCSHELFSVPWCFHGRMAYWILRLDFVCFALLKVTLGNPLDDLEKIEGYIGNECSASIQRGGWGFLSLSMVCWPSGSEYLFWLSREEYGTKKLIFRIKQENLPGPWWYESLEKGRDQALGVQGMDVPFIPHNSLLQGATSSRKNSVWCLNTKD